MSDSSGLSRLLNLGPQALDAAKDDAVPQPRLGRQLGRGNRNALTFNLDQSPGAGQESGGKLSTIEAVDQARAEAGLQPPREPTTQDISARAHELAKKSGGKLSTAAAVDQARAEAAALASRGASARSQQVWERRQAQHRKVQETLVGTALALERRLIAHARELIAASRRALGDDPLRARKLAIRAREAMSAIFPLYGKKPDHGPARRILQGANVRPA